MNETQTSTFLALVAKTHGTSTKKREDLSTLPALLNKSTTLYQTTNDSNQPARVHRAKRRHLVFVIWTQLTQTLCDFSEDLA